MTAAALTQTRTALADAAREARAAWTPWHSAAAVVVVVAAALPAFAPSWVHVDGVAAAFYRAVAATGLLLAVGLGGMPSLGQGAFMAFGAFAVALLSGRAGWPLLPAVLVGVAAAAAAGVVAAIGVVRLRRVFIAVTTWVLTWLVLVFLLAFPSVSGGAQGIVTRQVLSPTAHYELALVLLVAAVLGAASISRTPAGLELRAAGARGAAATALGVATARRRFGAFVASAAVGGLAGALSVDLLGVADASDFGPYRSFQLFVAVVIGGAASALGPLAGIAILALVSGAAGVLGNVEGVQAVRFEPMFAALLLLTVLGLGGSGAVPAVMRALRRGPSKHDRTVAGAGVVSHVSQPAALEVDGLRKRFGNVVAAADVALTVRAGEICALIGPNGSGKTTVLRMLAGTMAHDGGTALLDGRRLDARSPRERALFGLVRTLQSTAGFDGLTALDNVRVGASLRRRRGGALRTLLATPSARREGAVADAEARAALAAVGLAWAEDVPVEELAGPERRLVAIAAALATRPRVLLLDEPSAGASPSDAQRLQSLLRRLADAGVGILLVEHNLRLVRAVADRVVVLAAGTVIADGSADDVAADDAVRAAYLGTRPL